MATQSTGSNSETEIEESFRSTSTMSRVEAMEMKINMWILQLFKLRKTIDLEEIETLYVEFNELAASMLCDMDPEKEALTRLFGHQ
ncbi:hypothetical protein BLA29_015198, partial [Euroglyphus maynei]